MTLKELGDNIARVRRFRNLTQEDVALSLNISITSYAKIERGETNVSFLRLVQIAECLDVPVAQFVKESDSDMFQKLLAELSVIKDDVNVIKKALG